MPEARVPWGRWTGALFLATLWLAAPPVRADWLVTTTGSRVETQGAWNVRGKLVVFHLPDGTLASLRLHEVDLEASRALTERSAEPPAEVSEAPPAQRPALVLTDADVAHVAPESEEASEAEGGEEAASPQTEDSSEGDVRVVRWEQEETLDGVVVTGILRNESRRLVTDLALTVEVFDEKSQKLAEAPGVLMRASLAAGQTTGFRAMIPDLLELQAVRFRISHRAFEPRRQPSEEEGGGSEESEGSP